MSKEQLKEGVAACITSQQQQQQKEKQQQQKKPIYVTLWFNLHVYCY